VCKKTPAEGIAALYAYESQIPEICISKIEGLKTFYGMTSQNDWRYFTVHIEADKEHARVERELLQKAINSDNISLVKQGVRNCSTKYGQK
jgi:pyrroloquinoline-quinone synthase